MRVGLRRWTAAFAVLVCWMMVVMVGEAGAQTPGGHGGWRHEPVVATENLEVGGADIRVEFAAGETDLTREVILARVKQAAQAVSVYYGRFPVATAGVLIDPQPGEDLHGTTWGGVRGVQGFSRIRFGEHTTEKELASD